MVSSLSSQQSAERQTDRVKARKGQGEKGKRPTFFAFPAFLAFLAFLAHTRYALPVLSLSKDALCDFRQWTTDYGQRAYSMWSSLGSNLRSRVFFNIGVKGEMS